MYKPTLRLFRGTKIVIFPELDNINASLLLLTFVLPCKLVTSLLFSHLELSLQKPFRGTEYAKFQRCACNP